MTRSMPELAVMYSDTSTDHQYWFPEFEPPTNAGGCRFDALIWQFTYHFVINLWCSFCLPLYIFYAEEVEP